MKLGLFRGVLYVRKMFISEITAGLIFFFQEYLESELHDTIRTIRTIRIYLHFRAHRIVSYRKLGVSYRIAHYDTIRYDMHL